jgi:hypothetical protein
MRVAPEFRFDYHIGGETMRLRYWSVWIVICLTTLSLGACSQESPVENTPATTSDLPPVVQEPAAPSPVAEPTEQSISGQLRAVDVAAKTVTISDSQGIDQTFAFSDSTEIVGTAGAQGLTGQQGNQITVHYGERDGSKMAVRIEVIPR